LIDAALQPHIPRVHYWGEIETEIAGERVKVHFIVNQLAYSRRFHFPELSVQDRLVH
jgi:hypothetical protein